MRPLSWAGGPGKDPERLVSLHSWPPSPASRAAGPQQVGGQGGLVPMGGHPWVEPAGLALLMLSVDS